MKNYLILSNIPEWRKVLHKTKTIVIGDSRVWDLEHPEMYNMFRGTCKSVNGLRIEKLEAEVDKSLSEAKYDNLVLWVFHWEFAALQPWAIDPSYKIMVPTCIESKKLNVLVEHAVKLTLKMQKNYPRLNIVWTLPYVPNFFKYNTKLVAKSPHKDSLNVEDMLMLNEQYEETVICFKKIWYKKANINLMNLNKLSHIQLDDTVETSDGLHPSPKTATEFWVQVFSFIYRIVLKGHLKSSKVVSPLENKSKNPEAEIAGTSAGDVCISDSFAFKSNHSLTQDKDNNLREQSQYLGQISAKRQSIESVEKRAELEGVWDQFISSLESSKTPTFHNENKSVAIMKDSYWETERASPFSIIQPQISTTQKNESKSSSFLKDPAYVAKEVLSHRSTLLSQPSSTPEMEIKSLTFLKGIYENKKQLYENKEQLSQLSTAQSQIALASKQAKYDILQVDPLSETKEVLDPSQQVLLQNTQNNTAWPNSLLQNYVSLQSTDAELQSFPQTSLCSMPYLSSGSADLIEQQHRNTAYSSDIMPVKPSDISYYSQHDNASRSLEPVYQRSHMYSNQDSASHLYSHDKYSYQTFNQQYQKHPHIPDLGAGYSRRENLPSSISSEMTPPAKNFSPNISEKTQEPSIPGLSKVAIVSQQIFQNQLSRGYPDERHKSTEKENKTHSTSLSFPTTYPSYTVMSSQDMEITLNALSQKSQKTSKSSESHLLSISLSSKDKPKPNVERKESLQLFGGSHSDEDFSSSHSFSNIFVIGNKNLIHYLSELNIKEATLVYQDLSYSDENDITTILKSIKILPIKTVCILAFSLSAFTETTTVSPSCIKFSCKDSIPIKTLKYHPNNSNQLSHSNILKRIKELKSLVSKMSEYVPTVILPMFPSKVLCDDAASFRTHGISHAIANQDCYIVSGNEQFWKFNLHIIMQAWNDFLKINHDSLISSELTKSYINFQKEVLSVNTDLSNFESCDPNLPTWKSFLEILLKVFVEGSDVNAKSHISDWKSLTKKSSHEEEDIEDKAQVITVARNTSAETSQTTPQVTVKCRNLTEVIPDDFWTDLFKEVDPNATPETFEKTELVSPLNSDNAVMRNEADAFASCEEVNSMTNIKGEKQPSTKEETKSALNKDEKASLKRHRSPSQREKGRKPRSRSRSNSRFYQQRGHSRDRARYYRSRSRSPTSRRGRHDWTRRSSRRRSRSRSRRRSRSRSRRRSRSSSRRLRSPKWNSSSRQRDTPTSKWQQRDEPPSIPEALLQKDNVIAPEKINIPSKSSAGASIPKSKTILPKEDESEAVVSSTTPSCSQSHRAQFLEAEKELRKAHEDEYIPFKTFPELHPDYDIFYKEFDKDYFKKYDASCEDSHKEEHFAEFWAVQWQKMKEDSWKKKRAELVNTYKQKSLLLYQKRAKETAAKSPLLSVNSVLPLAVATPTASSVDNMSECTVEGALKLLEQLCDRLGVLGPAVLGIIKSARLAGPNSPQGLNIFVDSENVMIINMAIEKMKVMQSTSTDDSTRTLTSAIDWAQDLLRFAQKAKEPSLENLDLEALAKASVGKDSRYIIDMIKSASSVEGVPSLSTEEINALYMKVCSFHFKFQMNKI